MAVVVAADSGAEAINRGSGGNEGSGGNRGSGGNSKDSSLRSILISYVASYVGPIQTGFLRGFRKSSGGTEIMISSTTSVPMAVPM
jgi:hypothetical protein